MTEEINTKPTLETILERINAVAEQVGISNERINALTGQVTTLQKDVAEFRESVSKELAVFREEIEDRLDDIEKQTAKTRMDMLSLRMEFRELRGHLKETSPA